eukprot:snap_masked-scaffold_27-processed-gene-4.33-mRNA-1 protein AED:0.47 eAED:0.47 QI:0/-1/0/1/-1/1/1/0/118
MSEPKPILKHDHTTHTDKHISFDEKVISEHDKLRGTREKIDEPDTPYPNDDIGDITEQQQKVKEDLTAVKEQLENMNSVPEILEEVNHKQFEKKRKEHYNEFEKMKAWKKEHQNEEDE